MSAENTRECPNCLKLALDSVAEKQRKASESYGKVPPEDYMKMVQEATIDKNPTYSLDEYYELGMAKDGKFYISYGASCRRCTFEFQYNHEEHVTVTGTLRPPKVNTTTRTR